jgi:hypothetical protein
MIVGSLYLLWRGIFDLKSETKEATSMKVLGFEIKTPVAGLIMFFMGVVMLYIPIYYSPKMCVDLAFHQKKPLEMVDLRGKVSTDTSVEVFAIVDEQEANADQTIALSVPYLADRRYVVRYFNKAGEKVDEENFRLSKDDKTYELRGMRLKGPVAAASPTPAIKLEQQESSASVAEFTLR